MATVLMDDEITGTTHSVSTWAELLALLDAQCASSGTVVAAVQIDGRDMGDFRAPHALSRPLDGGTNVVVATARPVDLILQTLDDAEGAAHAIADAAVSLGGSYRAKDASSADRSLSAFAESLGTLIVLTSTAATSAGVNLATCAAGAPPAQAMIDRLMTAADRLVSARRASDWTGMADLLETDIADAVRQWPMVLQAIRQASSSLAAA